MRHALAQQGVEFLPDLFPARVAIKDAIVEAPALVAETEANEFDLDAIILNVYTGRHQQHALGAVS